MRHDPAIASIVIMLRELKMHGMAQAVAELAEQGAPAFDAAQPIRPNCSRPRQPSGRCALWPTSLRWPGSRRTGTWLG